jgi:hypothetical protein
MASIAIPDIPSPADATVAEGYATATACASSSRLDPPDMLADEPRTNGERNEHPESVEHHSCCPIV